MKKILLIGCGHMGEALLSSWIKSKKYQLNVVDPNRYNFLKKKYKNNKIKISKSILDLEKINNFYFIIIAVKPIDLNKTLDQLDKITLRDTSIIISVVAGKKINVFKNKFKKIKNFFRIMPNMPASVGYSMNCIVSNQYSSKTKKNELINLFNYSGTSLFLDNEDQIDMATAISGSGPGFVFNIIDAMENAAIKLGFSKKIAKILVTQTFKGSIELLLKNNLNAKDLVKIVATKGGTTEAGLKTMERNNIHKIFINLTKSSYRRAKKQGK